jgi:AcrR family transcriptional regulator
MQGAARGTPLWEEQALERSLARASARSAAQARRVVDAARELVAETGPDFTVQQVAARAGVALKTLYRSFPGKDALLLAVFEEDNRVAVETLATMIARHDAPTDRLRAFVTGLFELSTTRPDPGFTSLTLREYFRLAQYYSEQVEHVLRPFVDLLVVELEAAAEQGAVQVGDIRRNAAAVFLLAVSHLYPLILTERHADRDTANFVADFCLRAMGAAS